MAFQFSKLADIQYAPSPAASIYANGSNETTYVRGLVLFNGSTAVERVRLYNVPDVGGSVGTAGAANKFLDYPMTGSETFLYEPPYPHVLTDVNDSIQAQADHSNAVTVQILGAKET